MTLVLVALAAVDLEDSHCSLEVVAPEAVTRYIRQLAGRSG